jgi:hypothetical protein
MLVFRLPSRIVRKNIKEKHKQKYGAVYTYGPIGGCR